LVRVILAIMLLLAAGGSAFAEAGRSTGIWRIDSQLSGKARARYNVSCPDWRASGSIQIWPSASNTLGYDRCHAVLSTVTMPW